MPLGEMLAQPSGVLRASLPVDFAAVYLAPIITAFAERYPGISFDFDLTPRRVDLVTEPFHVAIRMGEQPSSSLIARQLALLKSHVYASPRYLERAGEPQSPADLTGHECLGFPKTNSWTLQNGQQEAHVQIGRRYVLNSVGMFRRLATLDQGLILLPRAVVADDLASGQLREVLPGWHGKPLKLTRFRGRPILMEEGVRYACIEASVPGGIPPTDGRTGPSRPHALAART
jgi:DNA-binding transcriptional LysR family regulator